MVTPDLLKNFARLYNLQTVYRDGFGQVRTAPPEAIIAVLKSLDAPVKSSDDLPSALRERRQNLWQRAIEPVLVAWQDKPLSFKVRLPQRLAETKGKYQVVLETGELQAGECSDEPGGRVCAREVEGVGYLVRSLVIQAQIPLGYHRLKLRLGDLHLESYVISATPQAYASVNTNDAKAWGVFCPLYALNSARSWGAGDYTDLATFAGFVGELKGQAVATLPMLASFLDEPFNPSPYAPVSRLFWNEFYLDVTRIPEFAQCPAAQAIVNSAGFQRDLNDARAQLVVDYRKCMALKRQAIEELLKFLLKKNSKRRTSFKKYVTTHPMARDYAAFRAKVERERKVWFYWPSAACAGTLTADDYDESAYQYHLYVQWQCDEQKRWLRDEAKKNGTTLYLDFPLGVNRDGYDVWRERNLFALSANGGAPPDSLFVKGQDWGFPPLHPDAIRGQGYRYYIDCIRHHMALAGMLRIDHIMGLHRAFWVPHGFSAAEGLYVHNQAQEYYAILCLESHRHHVQIVGENLGTVPFYVDEAMERHKILGMHVGIFGVNAAAEQALDKVPANTVASLNTHDTATFMGFWTGADIQDRVELGLLAEAQAQQEHQYRATQREALIKFLRSRGSLTDNSADPGAVLAAWLTFLAQNDEEFLLINLEDLWLEPLPQNTPGTWQERPNWQRKAHLPLETICEMGSVVEVLKTIGDIRGSDKIK
jgi:4-alpha-glucanotransferase